MRLAVTVLTSLFASTNLSLAQEAPKELWRASGFDTPESVLHDAANDRLIVSNIAGAPDQADSNGFLSILSPDGKVVTESWASGMDAPKGMAIAGDRLYVSDITKLHAVDLASGEIVETLPAEGAMFLNDVAATETGEVFVSDMLTGTIYRLAGGKLEPWLTGQEQLAMPNGLFPDGGRLIVGTWGAGMKPDFTTEQPGGLFAVDIASKTVTPLPGAENIGNMDGVVKIGETIYATDYIAGILYRYEEGGQPEKFATLKTGSADLGTDGKTLFVPMWNEGEVVALSAARN
jgi:sugar lactone lactonase YvrE